MSQAYHLSESHQTEQDELKILYTKNSTSGLHIVEVDKIGINEQVGILLQGHEESRTKHMSGNGVVLTVPRAFELIEKGVRAESIDMTSRYRESDRVCVWCGDTINPNCSGVEFKEHLTSDFFSEFPPTFHSSCFSSFRDSTQRLLDRPEILSRSI